MKYACLTPALLAAASSVWIGERAEQPDVAMPTTPPNIVHMPVHIANDLGLFKKYGLEIKVVELGRWRLYSSAPWSPAAPTLPRLGAILDRWPAQGRYHQLLILANMPKLEVDGGQQGHQDARRSQG